MQAERAIHAVDEYREIYERDGVVLVKNAFNREWIDLLISGWDRILAAPYEDIYNLPESFTQNDPRLKREMEAVKSASEEERVKYTEQAKGFIRYKYLYWWAPEFRQFILESPAAELIGNVIGASQVRYFVDAIFMKEAACDTKTYWHADAPAWPVTGGQVPTMWMPLYEVGAHTSSLEYIAGSHKHEDEVPAWPNSFNAKEIGRPKDRPTFYDWEQHRGDPNVKIVSFDMQPGDVVILHPAMHHGGGPNLHPTQPRVAYSTRWFGDNVAWNPMPECVNTPGKPLHEMQKGVPITEDDAFPIVWKR